MPCLLHIMQMQKIFSKVLHKTFIKWFHLLVNNYFFHICSSELCIYLLDLLFLLHKILLRYPHYCYVLARANIHDQLKYF